MRTVLAIAGAGGLAILSLDAGLSDLIPSRASAQELGRFFGAAFDPALDYQDPDVPADATPFVTQLLYDVGSTIAFAAAAMSISLLCGLVLAAMSSRAWWDDGARPAQRRLWTAISSSARFACIVLRSVHELMWAVIFLSAFGLNEFSAVLAIAIPFTGTLGKMFGELLDETHRDAASSLRAIGAGPTQILTVGLIPRALPDLLSYSLYQFECALRSSAVLGFFGFATIGQSLRQSFDNLHYREVWSCLYALLTVVLVLEWWSHMVRRRLSS